MIKKTELQNITKENVNVKINELLNEIEKYAKNQAHLGFYHARIYTTKYPKQIIKKTIKILKKEYNYYACYFPTSKFKSNDDHIYINWEK